MIEPCKEMVPQSPERVDWSGINPPSHYHACDIFLFAWYYLAHDIIKSRPILWWKRTSIIPVHVFLFNSMEYLVAYWSWNHELGLFACPWALSSGFWGDLGVFFNNFLETPSFWNYGILGQKGGFWPGNSFLGVWDDHRKMVQNGLRNIIKSGKIISCAWYY